MVLLSLDEDALLGDPKSPCSVSGVQGSVLSSEVIVEYSEAGETLGDAAKSTQEKMFFGVLGSS